MFVFLVLFVNLILPTTAVPPEDLSTLYAWTANWSPRPLTWALEKPCADWKGVTCDAVSGNVTHVILDYDDLATTTGPIDLGGLPRGLKQLSLTNGFRNISFVPERLPPNLELLNVDLNGLTGGVDFSKFPRSLKDLTLNSDIDNDFRR